MNRLATHSERLVYRVAGLPLAVAAQFHRAAADPIEATFAWRYWHPNNAGEWSELLGVLILWPVAAILAATWFTALNGRAVRRLSGKSITQQLAEQMRLYFSAGVLAPWYYIFSLYERDGERRAPSYLQRFQTKPAIFPLLKQRCNSPLNDKARFAAYCASCGVRCVPTLLHLTGERPDTLLPDCDLFVKPVSGRGGRGAERWNVIRPVSFEGPDDRRLSASELLEHLAKKSRRIALIVQPRLVVHAGLLDLTRGALPTVRIVTCLNEDSEPEVIGAVFRMAMGRNRTVDNLHAGGIAADVELGTGKLSCATNLGADARLGWLSVHPDTGGRIEGRKLPLWHEARRLAVAAHRRFADRVVIGWDIAILDDGPIVVEGNGNPDMDILQRFMSLGLREQRFGQLLGHHLIQRLPSLAQVGAIGPITPRPTGTS